VTHIVDLGALGERRSHNLTARLCARRPYRVADEHNHDLLHRGIAWCEGGSLCEPHHQACLFREERTERRWRGCLKRAIPNHRGGGLGNTHKPTCLACVGPSAGLRQTAIRRHPFPHRAATRVRYPRHLLPLEAKRNNLDEQLSATITAKATATTERRIRVSSPSAAALTTTSARARDPGGRGRG
jgi:hypothetical protein